MIRRAFIDDYDELCKLYIDGYRMHFKERPDYFNDKNDDELSLILKEELIKNVKKYMVIEFDNKLVGYCSVVIREKKNKILWVDELYIADEYRKHGFGKQLIEKIIEYSKENGCSKVELNCWSFNDNAIEFYRHLNFKEQRIIFEYEI